MREGTNDLYEAPTRDGHFGRYGGRFVAETLFHALDQLDALYQELKEDPDFRRELAQDLSAVRWPADAAVRSGTPDARTRGRADIPQARRPESHRRAQDQQHRRAGVVGEAHRQATHHRGDRRRSARRGHGNGRGSARSRVPGLYGFGRHQTAESQRLPDEAVRRGGGAGHVGFAHAQGRDERSDARLGDQCGRHPLHHRYRRRSASVSR